MKFFVDNNLSPHLAAALHALSQPYSHSVSHKRELFDPSTEDHEWITTLAKEGGWAIITQDRLRKSPLEQEALRSTGIVTFILKAGWSNLPEWEKAHRMVRWWPRVIEQAEGVTGGVFLVPVQFSGKGKFEPLKL